MNLAVAVKEASIEAVNATHASVIQDKKERRGTAPLPGAAAFAGAAALGAAGFGVAALAGGGAVAVTGAGSRESSLLIGISQ